MSRGLWHAGGGGSPPLTLAESLRDSAVPLPQGLRRRLFFHLARDLACLPRPYFRGQKARSFHEQEEGNSGFRCALGRDRFAAFGRSFHSHSAAKAERLSSSRF